MSSSLRVSKKRKDKVVSRSKLSVSKVGKNEDLSSDDEDIMDYAHGSRRTAAHAIDADGDEEADEEETADAKRLRVAMAYLDKMKAIPDEDDDDIDGLEDREGIRDSMVADRLKQKQQEESGRTLRSIVRRVLTPSEDILTPVRYLGRRHRQSVTSVVLSWDDSTAFSASKDGTIHQTSVETGQGNRFEWPSSEPSTSGQKSSRHILAMAISSDGNFLAAGGLDRKVHVWDVRTGKHVQEYKGHRGCISCLSFRDGTHELFSGSFDRSIKIWSVDDGAYMDSLYGHQSEIVALDCLRQERVLSAGRDRTCRIWKVPEETQLVLRGHSASIDCCAMITPNDFISGSEDGSVALWSSIRKKPIHIVRGAHGGRREIASGQAAGVDIDSDGEPEEEKVANGQHADLENGHQSVPGPSGSVGGAIEGWVGAVTVCRNSDLAASGAGDGFVRLWHFNAAKRKLLPLHKLPTNGFVNSLAFASSGRFVLAGTGQEPRLGRWGRIKEGRNAVIVHQIQLAD